MIFEMAGVYVHIPFCRQACSYCNFHFSTLSNSYDAFCIALILEIERRKDYLQDTEVRTLYFGGGTPSLLNMADLDNMIAAVDKHFKLSKNAEITLEVNPEDASMEKVRGWKDAGINRISMGIQSFRKNDLLLMNRNHSASDVYKAIDNMQAAGIENISGDLIYGIPNVSAAEWEAVLLQFLGLNLPHFSAYALTIEDKTLLKHQIRRGTVSVPDEDTIRASFEMLHDHSVDAGYDHYEVSGFARPGWYSVHNSGYWNGAPYLGLGPSAHSYNGKQRSRNAGNNYRYIRMINRNESPLETENLTIAEQYNEYVMTRLRTRRGADPEAIAEYFGEDMKAAFLKTAGKHLASGNLKTDKGWYRIPPYSMFVSDNIISDFFYVP